MSSFKPIDGSKEEFRKYLDRKGVLDAITKVLIKCNSDRPENPIQFLLDNMGERLKDKDTIARLENELNDARNEIEVLKREMNALKVNAEADNVPDDFTPGMGLVSTGQQQEEPMVAENPSSQQNEVTNNVDPGETVVTPKMPENVESDPKESGAQ